MTELDFMLKQFGSDTLTNMYPPLSPQQKIPREGVGTQFIFLLELSF